MEADVAPDIARWPDRLEQVLKSCVTFRHAKVLQETDSTQDAARRLNSQPGDVVIAGRQTRGRGRMGRNWIDEHGEGVAATMVIDRGQPERLTMGSAVGTARAIESVLGRTVGIKWPNDIVIDHKKLAGILIEQVDQRAFIGIGINVSQATWPDEVVSRAVSLVQLGCRVDRVDVLVALIRELDTVLQVHGDALLKEYLARDVLIGTVGSFANNGIVHMGQVLHVDPWRGLHVKTGNDEVWLSAATTTVVPE